LAVDGALFEHAICDVPWTTGSMASVFTGHYAVAHKMQLSTTRLASSWQTLAEVLHDSGLATGAVIGSFPLAAVFNLNQGFDDYDDTFDTPMIPLTSGEVLRRLDGTIATIEKIPPPTSDDPATMTQYFTKKVMNDAYRPDDKVTDRALEWLNEHANERFFLWVHYFGPHERVDFLKPWEEQTERVIAEYDKDLAFTDQQVGRLLSRVDDLGLRDRTFVILHSDHGQSLGENDYVGHGNNLYQPNLRIPLLMRLPGHIPPGRRVASWVRNIDLFPTVLSVLGIGADLDLPGRDLTTLLRDSAGEGDSQTAYSETYIPTIEPQHATVPQYGAITARIARRGVLEGNRMYVVNQFSPPCARADGTPIPDTECGSIRIEELFDPISDPQGLHNLAAAEEQSLPRYRSILQQLSEVGASPASDKLKLSPDQREKLRALGYAS
jgi:arylsulfatase A-like enzyme